MGLSGLYPIAEIGPLTRVPTEMPLKRANFDCVGTGQPQSNGGPRVMKITSNHKPTHEQIAQRAYAIFEQSGRIPGRDTQNWLQAEKELSAKNGHDSEPKQAKSNGKGATSQGMTAPRSEHRLERKYA